MHPDDRLYSPAELKKLLDRIDQADLDCAWELTGDIDTWHALLSGKVNLGVALRQGQLRYAREAEQAPGRIDNRLHFTARMLGLAR